jgi:mTERF domain-containing protein
MDAVFGAEIDGSNAADHGFDGKKPGFIHSSSASIPEAITKDPTTAKQSGYYDRFEINGHQKELRNRYTTCTQNEEDTTDKVWYQNEQDTAYTTPYPHDNDHNHHNVTLIRAPSARVSESLIYLKSLGADCRRIVSEEPSIVASKATDLRGLVSELEGYGLEWKDLGRIFNLCPRILRMDPGTDLKAVASFLFGEVGLARKDFAKVVRRCPRLLACSVEGQLEPTLRFLREMGFKDMGRVVASNATLLSFSVEHKILPKLRFLESIGLSSTEAISVALRFPAIFNYSIEDNLRPKYEYLTLVMGRNNRDLLSFPQFFGYSLDKKIRPRYERVARLRISLSLQAMLKLSEPEFNARFGSVEPEFSTLDSTAWSPNSTLDSTAQSPNSTPDSTVRRLNSTPISAAWRPNSMPDSAVWIPNLTPDLTM